MIWFAAPGVKSEKAALSARWACLNMTGTKTNLKQIRTFLEAGARFSASHYARGKSRSLPDIK
jgi:hypothetical protein